LFGVFLEEVSDFDVAAELGGEDGGDDVEHVGAGVVVGFGVVEGAGGDVFADFGGDAGEVAEAEFGFDAKAPDFIPVDGDGGVDCVSHAVYSSLRQSKTARGDTMNPDPQTERDQQIEAASTALAAYRESFWDYQDHGKHLSSADLALRCAEKLADQVTELIGYTSRLFRERAMAVSVTRTAMQQGEPVPPRTTVSEGIPQWIGPDWSKYSGPSDNAPPPQDTVAGCRASAQGDDDGHRAW
jgi:hypothetical protein